MSWFFSKAVSPATGDPIPDEKVLLGPASLYPSSHSYLITDANDILRAHGITNLALLKELLASPWAKELAKKKIERDFEKAKEEYEAKLKELI